MVWTLATWNVNSLKARKEQVLRYLELREPSLICLQETKLKDEAFPSEIFKAKGYQVLHAGGPGRNGVAILTRDPAEKIVRGLFSWWDYQFGAFRVNRGMRLDHIWVSNSYLTF